MRRDADIGPITVDEYNRYMRRIRRFHRMEGNGPPCLFRKLTRRGRRKCCQWYRVWGRMVRDAEYARECVQVCGPAS